MCMLYYVVKSGTINFGRYKKITLIVTHFSTPFSRWQQSKCENISWKPHYNDNQTRQNVTTAAELIFFVIDSLVIIKWISVSDLFLNGDVLKFKLTF